MDKDDLLFVAGAQLCRAAALMAVTAQVRDSRTPGTVDYLWEEAARTRITGLACIQVSSPSADAVFGE